MEILELKINDELYPQSLRDLAEPPQSLFCIGDISILKSRCVAVTGTRRCSPYGRWVTSEITKSFCKCGFSIVGGMSQGIATEAHKTALDNNGKTIAVLGTAIDCPYPYSNRDLYDRIAKNGLLISEYAPGSNAKSSNFVMRNRIIAGLSDSIAVIEAMNFNSNSILLGQLALTLDKEVYAVPGNINQPAALGTNQLIRAGATPIIDIELNYIKTLFNGADCSGNLK